MHASTTSILIAALASSSLAAPIFPDPEALNARNLAARNVLYQLATRDTPTADHSKQNQNEHPISARSVEQKDELDERDLEDFPQFDERDEDNSLDKRSPINVFATSKAFARSALGKGRAGRSFVTGVAKRGSKHLKALVAGVVKGNTDTVQGVKENVGNQDQQQRSLDDIDDDMDVYARSLPAEEFEWQTWEARTFLPEQVETSNGKA
ncbi:hypothetical protein DACRYDRAFT_23960 [Dacryopinax primogenitus]|uniref:Uncharacterized protein n=1 Tax=Dacryopinax primogenitus (strain DJM 731) TaxID=1858805 RepID=M5G6P9_DACPD|nr:uncharacterized protein DACRYDRAFT_23960 [Dacryopinax primogenitus]EJT99437.1 hypothetical protein DACRYDRAFT_23960 [Dacryopinax primogenitus]